MMKNLKTRTDEAGPTTEKSEGKKELHAITETKRKENKRRARHEAVLTKPSKGSSYAKVLKNLKSKVKPSTLGVEVKGIRQTNSGDVIIEVWSQIAGTNCQVPSGRLSEWRRMCANFFPMNIKGQHAEESLHKKHEGLQGDG